MKKLLAAGVSLVAVMLLVGMTAIVFVAREWLATPLAAPAGAVLEVTPGTPLARLARDLERRGWLDHPRWLTLLARWRGEATRIQAGEYRMSGTLTPDAFLAMLVEGRVIQYEITVIEGWNVRQAITAIRQHPQVAATAATADARALHRALDLPGGAQAAHWSGTVADWQRLEGWLFPDTYRFPRGTPDLVLVRQAHARMRRELDAAWRARGPHLPLRDPQELLVLASIVEKETALASERARIAGVFVRRLERGMRLQSDPTVIYGLYDAYDGDLRRRDLRTDTPHNTYTRTGLPPTPIALPGRAALQAAARPAPGDALYFVATGKGDGSHAFSATLAEHNAAVRRYLERTSSPEQP